MNVIEKLLLGDRRVPKGPAKGIAVHFIVIWKNNPPTVGVLHLNVTAFAMDFDEAHSSKSGVNLSAGQERQFHVNSTISACPRAASSSGEGSRYSSTASRIF